MKTTLFLTILLFFVELLHSQTDFKPGYIINLNGDTLYGEIDSRGDKLMCEKCKFKNSDNSIFEYTPSDISAFRFIKSKYFVSKEVNGKKYFLKYLINGKISIFYMRNQTGDHYFIEKNNEKLVEIPYTEKTTYNDTKRVTNESTVHIGILSYYTKDAPQLASQIKSIKKPDDKNLIKLAKQYQDIVSKDESCIIYEEKLPLCKLNPEFAFGIIKFQNIANLIDNPYLTGGFYAHISMPHVNDKLYFRTGLIYSQIKIEKLQTYVSKIPLQIEYIYPKGTIRPKFALGFNFYPKAFTSVSTDGALLISPVHHSFATMAGINMKLNKISYLSISYDIDFKTKENSNIFPQYLLSNQLTVGIFIKL